MPLKTHFLRLIRLSLIVAPSRSVMAGILPGAVRRNNPKLLDQVPAVSRLKHHSIRTEQAYTDWTRRFSVFHISLGGTMACGVIHGKVTDAEVSEVLTYFKASVRQFHTRDVCSRA